MKLKREPEPFRPYTIVIEDRLEHIALVDGLWRRYWYEKEEGGKETAAKRMYDVLIKEIG